MKRNLIIATVLILLGGIVANYLRFAEPMPDSQPSYSLIPMEKNGYFATEHRFDESSYDILQADTTTLRLYNNPDDHPIWLFIGYFESQKYGSQIHSPRHCLPGSGWKIRKHEPYVLKLADGSSREINRLIITERDRKEIMLYWFETRGGSIRSEFGLKWDLMMNSLALRPSDAAFIRVNLPLLPDDNVEDATNVAVAYLQEFLPDIERALPFDN